MARIEAMLEELRRTTDELHKLTEAARQRARRSVADSRVIKGRIQDVRKRRLKQR